MKKLLSLILTLAILLLCFAGCGKDSTTTSEPSESTGTSEPSGTGEPSVPADPSAPADPSVPDGEHVHAYGDWNETKSATCKEPGSRTRSCGCGDTQTETIPTIPHTYANGICGVCGDEDFPNELQVLSGLKIDEMYYCSESTIVYKANGKCYMADHTGKILTPKGYQYMLCANAKGYVSAYNSKSEVVSSFEDVDFGTLYTTRYVDDCYVLDKNGNVVFQTQYTILEAEMEMTTYSGEYIASCNEDRIITYTSDTYHHGMAGTELTVNIYNMQGSRLAQFTGVSEVGTLINGKLAMIMSGGEVMVVDKDGKVLCRGYDFLPEDWYEPTFGTQGWVSFGFINGYMMLKDSWNTEAVVLVSEDLSKSYKLYGDLLSTDTHNGTLVVSKVVTNGSASAEYYLIDLTKCSKDADGYSIPTLDAAVYAQGYDVIALSCIFGSTEPYALVSRNDQWGYLALDGSVEKMYDDAGSFYKGKAIVKSGDRIFVIDENFNQITNTIKGYTSVSDSVGNVFNLGKGNSGRAAAIFIGS